LAARGVLALALALVALAACGEKANPPERLRLATTTSTENSGLLGHLLPVFQEATGIEVQVLSMGTGKALATGERGDCDVVLVHAPDAEEEFVAEGFGERRHPVMWNDFVVLGPAADAAGLKGESDVVAAFRKIAETGAAFTSRGDDSGTHQKELEIWKEAGLDPEQAAAGYVETGQGMGATLTQASERAAYVLADRATWLSYQGRLALQVLVEGDTRLRNPYAVIVVSRTRHPHVNHAGADRFVAWLTGPEGQRLIGEFKVGGEVLFHPDARP
jgi:tungstate transport system substrate-binding protein